MPNPEIPESHRCVADILDAALPIADRAPFSQAKAKKWQIFELQMAGNHQYYFLPSAFVRPILPPHGKFMYVILPQDPGRIYCAAELKTDCTPRMFQVEGHTSISRRSHVLYAGEIFLAHGNLIKWNNSSGHYRPSARLRDRNMLPRIKRLLPDEKFINYWEDDDTAPAPLKPNLVSRGYTDLI